MKVLKKMDVMEVGRWWLPEVGKGRRGKMIRGWLMGKKVQLDRRNKL